MYTARSCRSCGGSLDSILNLGNLALSGFPLPTDPPLPRVPLDLCACAACRLVQLRHTVDSDLLYRQQYWYQSGINETMRAELHDVVDAALAVSGPPKSAEFVVDIGANDGTLLEYYRELPATRTVVRVAFEPAKNLHRLLRPHAEVCVSDFFPAGLSGLKGLAGRVRVLTSIAMFYDIDDPKAFVRAVDEILHPDGVWVVQFQDLGQMLAATAFDNITPEHLCYYSLASFERLLDGTGLHVSDVERRAINGGSYRLFVRHRTEAIHPAVDEFREREQTAGIGDWQALETFAWQVGEVRKQITAAVQALADAGLTIDVYAASTKFNTLAQYCAIGPAWIRQAWERSPEKVGRETVTGIPIVSETDGRLDPPHALLLGAWQWRDAFIQREAEYLRRGGSMIVPLPSVDIISGTTKGVGVYGVSAGPDL